MNQKIIFAASSLDRLKEVCESHHFEECFVSLPGDGTAIACVYPRHAHTRFALSDEDGIVVLPTGHDPAAIGDLHRHLAHIGAQPHHTGRDIGLMLHAKHGPQFHPDV